MNATTNGMRAPGERFVLFECAGDVCVGVLSMPQAARPDCNTGVVIVTGGPQYRAGSHRQFVLLARALAATGIPVLRFDYRGSGDSEGAPRTFDEVGDDITAAIGAIRSGTGVARVVLWALCDGASAALMHAASHPDVAGVVAVNPWARSPQGEASTRLRHYYAQRLMSREFWQKIRRGQFDVRGSANALAGTISDAAVRTAAAPTPAFLARMERGWSRLERPVLFILSGRDLTAREFEAWVAGDRRRRAMLAGGDVDVLRVDAADHTFSSRAWRDAVAAATIEWMHRLHPSVLMIAYHFPPLRGSSGIQRTLRFCRYLPEFGWQPVVLTAHPRAYEERGEDLLADVPAGLPVTRAFALDTARHLAVGGRYPRSLALPDRWSSWVIGGVVSGLKLARQHRIAAIYSTYPIATAHLIALVLQRLTGLPWIADFRDPMAQDGYPQHPQVWRSFRWIEEQALRRSQRALFTSPGAIRDYRARYPDIPAERFVLVENGYDEEAFADAAATAPEPQPVDNRPFLGSSAARRLVVLHSGIVYTSERDPTAFFRALAFLKHAGAISAATIEFRFRATANDAMLHALAATHGIADLLTVAPAVPYHAALREMLAADALLILQAGNCNSQIPAKVYEYLRADRPVLALTDPEGDTAGLMHRAGIGSVLPLDSTAALVAGLPAFIDTVRSGAATRASSAFVARCSRRERTRVLSELLDSVALPA